ncbi:MAG: hypothetical protein QNK23_17175 [Crocinitomicaceae bacterium]|nr:hypothetical protein [Crocinitomicaceae bacterium]
MTENVEEKKKDKLYPDGNRTQMETAKKNLIYVGIISVFMLFAGLISAYIVSMGDMFWLKYPLPSSFWISTVLLIISSVAIQLAIVFVKKGNTGALKMATTLTLILGIGFVYFQMKGYGQFVDNGIHMANNRIIVTEGRYGDYFEVKYNGDFIEVNGNDYLIKGQKMTDDQVKEYQDFMAQFLVVDEKNPFEVTQYGNKFELYFNYLPMAVNDGALATSTGEPLEFLDRGRLSDLAINVRDKRGDFFIRGEFGKDFHLFYKRKELQYEDRELKLDGQTLGAYLQIKSMESPDTASSYLYMITGLHLLHIFFTLFFMVKIVIRSFSGAINADNNISLRMGAIFWHFLGILWIGLLLFLLYIH